MSEYWVSRDKYFCKYCKIYIADDKPSRLHHDSGMRHKGNYERYIRDIYKRGERDIKDKAEEAREIARMEAAAHAAMAADGTPVASTSSLPPPPASTKPKPPPKPTDPFANYSTAADLGFEDPDADKNLAEKEARQNEGVIGGWQKVVKPPPAVLNQQKIQEEKAREEEELRWKEKEQKRLGKYFKEKTAGGDEEVYDPASVATFNLKRKRLTLKEEAELAEEEEKKARIKKEREDERERESVRRRKSGKKDGWDQVEVEAEPMLTFDEEKLHAPKEEEESVKAEPIEGELAEDGKLGLGQEDVKPSTGGPFKKRKMFGANSRKK